MPFESLSWLERVLAARLRELLSRLPRGDGSSSCSPLALAVVRFEVVLFFANLFPVYTAGPVQASYAGLAPVCHPRTMERSATAGRGRRLVVRGGRNSGPLIKVKNSCSSRWISTLFLPYVRDRALVPDRTSSASSPGEDDQCHDITEKHRKPCRSRVADRAFKARIEMKGPPDDVARRRKFKLPRPGV